MAEKTIHFPNPRALSELYCAREQNLAKVESSLGVKLVTRDDWLKIEGEADSLDRTEAFFELMEAARAQGLGLRQSDFEHTLNAVTDGRASELKTLMEKPLVLRFKRRSIVPKTVNQKEYLKLCLEKEVVFGIGPAGTGKTYLAVAAAVEALQNGSVERLILTRPAVEAGEALGFLPGDLQEKILPYLRPLYDAMYAFLGREQCDRLIERQMIEVAPLAYMRGRTLSDAYIILDEAQNTTPEQMMMFLTRLGEGSRMVVTGDVTQIDLPRHKKSGLREAAHVLKNVPGIEFFHFLNTDVVRHQLVQRIIAAYDRHRDEAATGDAES